MTTTDHRLLHSRSSMNDRAVRGLHTTLIIAEAPAGATAQAQVGKSLVGQTLSVNGDYVCLIPLSGLASTLTVKVKPQLAGGATLSSSGPDELELFDPRSVNVAAAEVLTAGSGDGALADDTTQTATLTLTGALYARYTLTVASAGTVTFDIADATGL
jgi:hypothetical protein